MTDLLSSYSALDGAFARRMVSIPSSSAIRRASSCPCAAITEQAKSMLITTAQATAITCQTMQTTLDECQTMPWQGQAATQFKHLCCQYATTSLGVEQALRATIQAIQHW